MFPGPALIFDKSFLQALNPDEAMWLENFYSCNITPLFFVETLADLEKDVREGKTSEEAVGSIAYKTPDMATVNIPYKDLIAGELLYGQKVEMSGRPIVSEGRTVELGGKTGMFFQETPEMTASRRWEKKQFLEIERNSAKAWREELKVMGEEQPANYEKLFDAIGIPKTFLDLKEKVDFFISKVNDEKSIRAWMSIMILTEKAQDLIIERWKAQGARPIKDFAPYFSYVITIDLFFSMGTAAGLFSAFRHPQTHKVDIAYLYYLPFCKVFTSSDKIHISLAPIFMSPEQTFLDGATFKLDLAKLDAHYSLLPEETKNQGVITFGACPPDDLFYITTQMWDKYMPKTWRELQDKVRKFDGTDEIDLDLEKEITQEMMRFAKESKPIDGKIHSDKLDSILTRHKVSMRKGKWRKFPSEVENSKPLFDD